MKESDYAELIKNRAEYAKECVYNGDPDLYLSENVMDMFWFFSTKKIQMIRLPI